MFRYSEQGRPPVYVREQSVSEVLLTEQIERHDYLQEHSVSDDHLTYSFPILGTLELGSQNVGSRVVCSCEQNHWHTLLSYVSVLLNLLC